MDGDEGNPIPRFSQDATALRLCEEVRNELNEKIPEGKRVRLVLESPINRARQLKRELAKKIVEEVKASGTWRSEVECEIFGNKIVFQVIESKTPSDKKVIGLVVNQRSSANILMNAQYILEDRIIAKDKKSRSLNLECALWLALLNDYWLAGADTYRQAITVSPASHRFDKILVVSRDKTVLTLYSKL